VHNKSSTKNQNAHAERNPKTIARTVRKAKIQRASQKAWRRIKDVILGAAKQMVKTPKSMGEGFRAEPQYNGLGDCAVFN
jgi:hypothetical protein